VTTDQDSCREKALNCANLAAAAKTDDMRAHWRRMEQFWLQRANARAEPEPEPDPSKPATPLPEDDTVVLLG
jgi:hypothetical protein